MDENEVKRLIEEHEGDTVKATLQGDLTVSSVDAVKDELFLLLNSKATLANLTGGFDAATLLTTLLNNDQLK